MSGFGVRASAPLRPALGRELPSHPVWSEWIAKGGGGGLQLSALVNVPRRDLTAAAMAIQKTALADAHSAVSKGSPPSIHSPALSAVKPPFIA